MQETLTLQVNLDVRKHIPQMGCLNRPGYGSLGINLIAKIFILGEILLKGRLLTFRHRPGEIFINSVISFYVRHHFSYNFLSNLQKITCIILRNLFGLYLFSHQSCATGTLLLRK